MTLNSSLVAGNANVTFLNNTTNKPAISAIIDPFFGFQDSDAISITADPAPPASVPKNTTVPFSMQFTVPATLAPGIYQIRVLVQSDQGSISHRLAEQIQIPGALGSLPAPPPTPPTSPTGLDLSTLTWTAIPGRTSTSISITNGGQTANLTNNTWEEATIPTYTVTANTVMEFDFTSTPIPSTQAPSISGIGLLPTSALNTANLFEVGGSQAVGVQAAPKYNQQLGGTIHYVFPLGKSYTAGSMTKVFVVQSDPNGNANTSSFSHIHIYEGNGSVSGSAAWAAYPDSTILPTAIDLSKVSLIPWSAKSNTGTAKVVNGNIGAQLKQNMWAIGTYNYTVTAKTVMEFDFAALNSDNPNIYGIGLLPNTTWNYNTANNDTFQLLGTQAFGHQQFHNYALGTGMQHYIIPIGTYLAAGTMTNLVFIGTDTTTLNANALFSNIQLYESP